MKRFFTLVLAAALCLSSAGCAWMEGNYVSISPHQVSYAQPDASENVVSSYTELRSVLTGLVDKGATEGLITLVDYEETKAIADMDHAVLYASTAYPIGAYAVEAITYEYGSGGGQNVISVDITYRHTKSEIEQIRTIRGMAAAEVAIADALGSCRDALVLQITGYQETDIVQYVADYAADHPDIVMELPQTSVQIYPQKGDVRVMELQFAYQTSRDNLRYMQSQVAPVFSSASLYVSSESDEETKFSQLYTFLMERFDYTIQTSITPAYSLLNHGVGDSKAFAQVYAAMCRQAGLEALWVSGTCDGESRFWNIVRVENRYYHVDLLRCVQSGGFSLVPGEEMVGYVWDYSAYPSDAEADS